MKGKTKKISCYLIVILLTLLLPFTMVLAEETEKNMEEPVGSGPITTIGAMDSSDAEIPTIGAEFENDINESTPVTNPGDNPASVDKNQIIVPIAIGGTILVAAIITIIVIKKKKGN